MKFFVYEDILAHTKSMLSLIGIWPESQPSLSYRFKTTLTFTCIVLAFLNSGVQANVDFRNKNYEKSCFEVCLVICCIYSCFKVCYLQAQMPKFLKIVECLKDPAIAAHEDRFDKSLQNLLIWVHRIRLFILYSCLIAAASVVIVQLLEDYTKTTPFVAIQATTDNIPYYILVFTITAYLFFNIAYIIGAYTGFVFTLICLSIAQFIILHNEILCSLENITTNDLTSEELQKRDVEVNKLLTKCVLRHNAIERYVAAVQDKLSLGFLLQLLFTLTLTCFIAFCIVISTTADSNLFMSIFIFIGDIAQLAAICLAGQETIYQSTHILDACYMSNWEFCGPSVRKTVFIIMEKSKRPIGFSAEKFLSICLATLVALLKTSMSYFTVLQAVYEAKQQ